jgi:putative spermidine/putrescine transport system ATP-binding protein
VPADVTIEGVTKRFDDVVAVDNLSLEIESGSFFALLGPSGCGKTTTLRMIGGFEEPTEGTIYLGDAEVSRLPSYKRDVNTVFQSYALFPHLSIFDNVAFGLRRKGVSKGEVAERVGEALELVDLTGREKRKPNQLSGGQQQRVALARALVNRPRVLLLDEPLGALDLKLRQRMQIELKSIQREVSEHVTFVYVTHDQDEALTMSDRIAVFSAGAIEQVGTPGEIYERPANEFVAGFVGTSNVIERDGRRYTIRPEKIRMLAEAEPTDGASAEGTVREVSYLGSVTRYTVELEDATTLVVVRQNLDTSAESALAQRGRRVRLAWREDDASMLDTTQQKDGTR